MKTFVVNKYKDKFDIYIGRGSKWGNPFEMEDKSNYERNKVCREYELYFWEKGLLNNISELKGKSLGCYCKPKRCHGDLLAWVANNNVKERTKYRIIIAGSRTFNDYEGLRKVVSNFVKRNNINKKYEIEIVSGGANGADKLGEELAKKNDIKLEIFPAQWDKLGKRAGYVRNSEMANWGTHLLAFWDGESRGTKHMIELAKKKGLEIKVIKF